jgi:site-specific DNA-methyltransferase (adenine-specific)
LAPRETGVHEGRQSHGGVGLDITAPATSEAERWQGWGTALKPAFEPIVVGRKPLAEKTVAANVLAHGTGALNIDATRTATTDKLGGGAEKITTAGQKGDEGWTRPWMSDAEAQEAHAERVRANVAKAEDLGRWPANVILDESQAAVLDQQAPNTGGSGKASGPSLRGQTDAGVAYGARNGLDGEPAFYGDRGGASRFFYVAKAPKSERPIVELADGAKLAHPTVKPVAIMRWLVRLVTPPGGLVLDTFAGTGTTGEACVLEGFQCLLAEDPAKGEQDYLPLIDQRITRALLTLPSADDDEKASA